MNSVFLSPHFPPNFYNFAVHLKGVGARVLGIADEPWERLNPALRDALTEYYKVNDLHNYDELVRAMGYFTHKYGKLNHIDSHNEYWLETESRLRTDFNIPGIRFEEIGKIKRKSEMKRVFQQAGLKTARGAVCLTEDELMRFIGEVGFPVVAKPDIGVGAAQTFKLKNREDVAHYLVEKPPVDYIVEEFVDGAIVTFDGLTDQRGNMIFCTTMTYNKGVMDIVNENTDMYYSLTAEIDPEIEAAGRATLKAFNVKARFFHFEFFQTPGGEIYALEVNMRPPGGLTVDMWNYLYDFDCYRTWAEMIVNGISKPMEKPQRCVIYVSRKDHIPYSMTHQDVVDRFRSILVHHERMSPVLAGAMGNDGYILRAATLASLTEAAETIQQRQ
jgi:hypothetical protein